MLIIIQEIIPFCQPFYEEVKLKFRNILEKIKDRPTMFEVNQRAETTLLNQIGEFFFALSGGGHIRAAEFRTRSSGILLSEVLKEFFDLLTEL